MHVFVAGGAGYIGSVLVPALLESGHRVTVLDRMYFGDTLSRAQASCREKLRVVRGDVRSFDPGLLASVDAAIDLIEQRRLLGRDNLLEHRDILHAQGQQLLVNRVRALHQALRLRVGHGVILRGILL